MSHLIKKICLLSVILLTNVQIFGCTDIVAGKKATKDGSVLVSHTGAAPDCRIHVVPAQTLKRGDKAPVYYGLQDANVPFKKYGEIIGYIPQVGKTYKYFHSAYSHMNEFQLAIGESTMSQREELEVDRKTGKQIMTIEQAQIFALQRCKTAREAILLIGQLVTDYGFLPSAGPNPEALCIADKNEVWIMETFSVGKKWTPESGKPGAIWAAQRVPDDHVAVVPNWSVIKEINVDDKNNFLVSTNYKQEAIDRGFYNPNSGRPFVWQEAYGPEFTGESAFNRLWLFYTKMAPNLKKWPNRSLKKPYSGYDAYHHPVETLAYYPFSVKPEKKISVQDIIAFQRSVFEGTIYDMSEDADWYVRDEKGNSVKSPMATPFPTKDMRNLLDITWHRNVSKGGYGMVCQLRSWLPDAIGGVYWVYLDNQLMSTYVPIYAGVNHVSPYYHEYNPKKFSENSARWLIDMVDNLLYLKYQEAIKDVRKLRDPLEQSFFDSQPEIETKALAIYKTSPEKAGEFLTNHTVSAMEKVVKLYRELRDILIVKYTNNHEWL